MAMTKRIFPVFFFLLCCSTLWAQETEQQAVDSTDTVPKALLVPTPADSADNRLAIALFSPLYLDSAFDATNTYRYGNEFPRFINPGLEFYEGAMLAIDSLQKEGHSFDLHIYDTRSKGQAVLQVLKEPDFAKIDLVLGHVNNTEARLLANAAAQHSIPFINVNFPNDAGVKNNPNYVILNSTLITHVKAMYAYLQKHHALDPITVYTRKGPQEDMFKKYFNDISASTRSVPLKLNFVSLNDQVSAQQLIKYLNADKRNISIGASLDIKFAQKLAAQFALVNEQYPVSLFGMPTWDVIDFSGPEYKNLEIFISTPFYINPEDPLFVQTENAFKAKYFSRPTDMVFRGFETVYHFTSLLKKHGSNISSSLGDASSKIFTALNIQPHLNPGTLVIDYYENKQIYFIRKVDGEIVGAD